MNASVCLLLNFASTWAMVGLIWLIQIVHYPLFSRVGADQFKLYEQEHQRLSFLRFRRHLHLGGTKERALAQPDLTR